MVNYKLAGYKTFLDYKDHLYNDYLEKCSLLIYLKVKVLVDNINQ